MWWSLGRSDKTELAAGKAVGAAARVKFGRVCSMGSRRVEFSHISARRVAPTRRRVAAKSCCCATLIKFPRLMVAPATRQVEQVRAAACVVSESITTNVRRAASLIVCQLVARL